MPVINALWWHPHAFSPSQLHLFRVAFSLGLNMFFLDQLWYFINAFSQGKMMVSTPRRAHIHLHLNPRLKPVRNSTLLLLAVALIFRWVPCFCRQRSFRSTGVLMFDLRFLRPTDVDCKLFTTWSFSTMVSGGTMVSVPPCTARAFAQDAGSMGHAELLVRQAIRSLEADSHHEAAAAHQWRGCNKAPCARHARMNECSCRRNI